jgi:hypothetical protein
MTFMTVGCGAAAPPSNPSVAKPQVVAQKVAATSVSAELPRSDSLEQKDAQRVWCEYLDALHRRAATSAAAMPSLGKCLEARTYASPNMLRQTARCSREALEQFEGDPFTNDYAAEVARCGSQALDASEALPAELDPFVGAICSCVERCGEANLAECNQVLDGGLKMHLSRAVGAMNNRGRAQFEGCLKKLKCGDMGSQIVACLDPIMEGLLWLPE